MKKYYLLSLIIASNLVHGIECENRFLDGIAHDVQSIQEGLRSDNSVEQLKAILEMRAIKPDSITINRWIIPFLKSKYPRVRLSALQVIEGATTLHPQFIGVLLLHLREEESRQVSTWIRKRISHIPPNVRWAFYQGQKIANQISQLNVHFNEMNYWFDTILGISNRRDIAVAINSALKKRVESRNVMEREMVKLHKESQALARIMKDSLLGIPYETYEGFLGFLHSYMTYSHRPIYMSEEVQALIQFFYAHFYDISS